MEKYRFTEDDDKFLVEHYKKLTYKEMAEMLNLSVSQVNHRLNRHLIKKDDKKKYKHKPNEKFFKKWSRDMAYVLGFICADGYMYDDGRRNKCKLGISVHVQDKELLIKIAKSMSLNEDIVKTRNNAKMCEMSVYNSNIYCDLLSIGITPRKSLTLEWIEVPKEYRRDFIRGYFDGDGSITIQSQKNSNYKKPTIQFLGTQSFLSGISKVFEQELGIPFKESEKTKTQIRCLRYRTKQARTIMDYLYEDIESHLYMQRKKDKYDNYKKEVQRLSKA